MPLPPMATAWAEVADLGIAHLRGALDYDDTTAPTDGQAILWVASGSKFAPRTVVLPTDPALTNARTPTLHAASHAVGGADDLSGSYVPWVNVASANGVASLDAGGKVPQAQIPAIALTEFLGAVASQSAMLALTGQRGDWASRTDLGTDWQLIAEPSTSLASWREMTYPASPVSSVNGRAGAVTGLAEAAATQSALDTKLDQTAGDARYRQHNQPVRTGTASTSVSIDGTAAGDFDLTCTGNTTITPTGTPGGRTLVVTCLASGGARTPVAAGSVSLTTGVASRSLAIPSGGVGRLVFRYTALGSVGWSLDSAYLVG